jgi:hypothetical protein
MNVQMLTEDNAPHALSTEMPAFASISAAERQVYREKMLMEQEIRKKEEKQEEEAKVVRERKMFPELSSALETQKIIHQMGAMSCGITYIDTILETGETLSFTTDSENEWRIIFGKMPFYRTCIIYHKELMKMTISKIVQTVESKGRTL